jgi:ABC-type multidrug transport system fused ATPase/permease subunit
MNKIKNFYKLINLIHVNKYYLLFLILLMLISSILDLISLGLIAPYISSIFKLNNNYSNNLFTLFFFENYNKEKIVLVFTIFLILIFFLKTILSIIIRWLIVLFASKQYAILQVRLMKAYQNMKYEDYLLRSSSEYIRNIRELCSDCLSYIDLMLRLISEFVILLVIIIFLIFLNYKILLFIFLIIMPIFLIYEKILKPINLGLGKNNVEASKQIYKNIDAGIKALKEIRVLSKEEFFTKKLSISALKIYKTQKISSLISDSPRYVFEFFVVSSALTTFLILSFKESDFKDYLPTLGVFLLAGLRLLPSFSLITSSLSRIGYTQYGVKKVCEDLELYSQNTSVVKKKIQNKIKKFESIKLEDVSFNYNNSSKLIFKNINFSIYRNSCIGIVGDSGIGKTTLVDLLLGLIKPKNGKIFVNNISINDETKILLSKIAYLPQEPIILDEDIKTNVTLKIETKKINNNKILKALKKANLIDFINKLPKKLETVIGEGGIRLSGGQNKRLALARAFYHGREIIIMDEATSSLDIINENYIAEQIKYLKGKITIIIISHQKNILKYCDKIYKIENKNINLIKNNF